MTLRQAKLGYGAIGAALVLVCLSLLPAQERRAPQRAAAVPRVATEKTPAMLLPADPIVYIGWDGEAAHRDAAQKTAAYQSLQATGLMTVAQQMFQGLGANASNEQQAVLQELMAAVSQNGLSLAITTPAGEGFALPWGAIVLHGAAEFEPRLNTFLQQAVPGIGATVESQERAGRTIGVIRFAQFPPAEIGWWVEGSHLMIAFGVQAIDNATVVANGKAEDVTKSRLWKAYRDGKPSFETNTFAWLDAAKLMKTVGPITIPMGQNRPPVRVQEMLEIAGLDSTKAYVLQSGFDGTATVSELRVETAEDRGGLNSLAFQEAITLDALPPLPAKISAFHVASFDFSKLFDVVAAMTDRIAKFGPPNAQQQINTAFEQAREAMGVDPKPDLLDPLGNVICFYNDSSQGPLILGLTIAISVDDADKLRASLDTLLERATMQLPPNQLNIRRTQKHDQTVVTLEIAGGFGNPAFMVTDEWLVLSIVPQNLETFLMRSNGTLPKWKAEGALAKALGEVPKEFTSLSVSDPKESYRLMAGLAPIVLPILRRVAMAANPDISLDAAVADLPPAELVVEPLFPNVAFTYADGNTLVRRSRTSLPGFLGGDSGSVGVATTAIAVALLLPAVQQARMAARRTQSKNNLKQIVLGLHNYHDTFKTFPSGTIEKSAEKSEDRLSWMASLLPFVEQVAAFNELKQDQPWDANANQQVVDLRIPTFLNPSIGEGKPDEPGQTHYVGIAGVGKDAPTLPIDSPKAGIFGYNRQTKLRDVLDGTSNTLIVTEATADSAGPWAQGGKSTIRALTTKPYVNGPDGIGGPYPGGFNAATADGAVRFVSENIDPKVLEALATMRGGEVVGDW